MSLPAEAAPPKGIDPTLSGTYYRFFTAAEAAFVDAAVARLIPADELGPGAREAGVTRFIDRQLAGPWGSRARSYAAGPWLPGTPQQGRQSPLNPCELFRAAIDDCGRWCVQHRERTFAALESPFQDEVLQRLERDDLPLPSVSGKEFFDLLWTLTQEGFFADPVHGGNADKIGWRLVGFPGIPENYTDWIERHGQPYTAAPISILDIVGGDVPIDPHGHPRSGQRQRPSLDTNDG